MRHVRPACFGQMAGSATRHVASIVATTGDTPRIQRTERTQRTVQRILNVVPSRNTEQDWSVENAVGAGLLPLAPPVPPSVDLRETWWPVGDQGGTGSCVGWAAADSVLRWHFVKAGRMPETQTLSVRYIWMAAKESDEFSERPSTFIESDGTSLKAALDVARKYGVV